MRVKTGPFAAASSALREAELITDARDGQYIALKPGVGTDQIVRFLVERGLPVYEIACEEETLEQFYLGLMNKQKADMPRAEASRPGVIPPRREA